MPTDERPNVVLVLLDDVGFGSLGCYGAEIDTEAIDGLASAGVTFTNFHVTPLCSPTRAALLTGRNHHSVGMGFLSNNDTGQPGYAGQVSNSAATIAEVLGQAGYATFCTGKWHLAPADFTSAAGPYDQWPLGRGFHRFYGFLDALTDHFYPDLVYDNHRVPQPKSPEDGYHLSEDIVDHAIEFIRDKASYNPDQPFFLYVPFGATHTPHQAPTEYCEKYRGSYQQGWDEIRDQRFRRQKELGVIPADTQLAPRNPGVEAWDGLSDDAKYTYARFQEIYAAMLDHTDDQIGRIVDYLRDIDELDNTIFLVMADNGASQEGGPHGSCEIISYENELFCSVEDNIPLIEQSGGPGNHVNYPWGWAQAANTPLKLYKQNTHGGGVRAPMVMSWPAGVEAGTISHEFCHAIDVAPTLFDLIGVTPGQRYNGIDQMPIHGASLRPVIEGGAGSSGRAQYFEMLGHRAIWHDGWKAVARHPKGQPWEDDVWELYHLARDVSECDDRAEAEPDRLRDLIDLWWSEADRYQALPLDDRYTMDRLRQHVRDGSIRSRTELRLYAGLPPSTAAASPAVTNRSHLLSARIAPWQPGNGDRGVLVAHGDVSAGYVLYVDDGHLVYEYRYREAICLLRSDRAIPPEAEQLAVRFDRTAECEGDVELLIDDIPAGRTSLTGMAKNMVSWTGLSVGADLMSPVSTAYERPNPFTGGLRWVDVSLS